MGLGSPRPDRSPILLTPHLRSFARCGRHRTPSALISCFVTVRDKVFEYFELRGQSVNVVCSQGRSLDSLGRYHRGANDLPEPRPTSRRQPFVRERWPSRERKGRAATTAYPGDMARCRRAMLSSGKNVGRPSRRMPLTAALADLCCNGDWHARYRHWLQECNFQHRSCCPASAAAFSRSRSAGPYLGGEPSRRQRARACVGC